jgi:hypothetical protein
LHRCALRRDFAEFKRGQRFYRIIWRHELLRLEFHEKRGCLPTVVDMECIPRLVWKPKVPFRNEEYYEEVNMELQAEYGDEDKQYPPENDE